LGFKEEAHAELAALAKKLSAPGGGDADSLTVYVAMSLTASAANDLEPWLLRLEELAPNAFQTLELRTRWLQHAQRAQEIPAIVDDYVNRFLADSANASRKDNLFLTIGNLYVSLKMYAEAETYYRRVSSESPKALLGLLRATASQGKWTDAIGYCQQATRLTKSAQPASLLVALLVNARELPADLPPLEAVVNESLSNFGDDATLLVTVANLRIRQQKLDEAMPLLTKSLEIRPRDATALNNLAAVLSELPGRHEEAVEYVDQAMILAGPVASMLDTKGMALLYANKVEDAIPLIEAATHLDANAPVHAFHLAVAYDRSGAAEKARVSFETAMEIGIETQILTPADRRMLQELRARYFSGTEQAQSGGGAQRVANKP
jgi:tetratricopeptide (TPR) repeat protein